MRHKVGLDQPGALALLARRAGLAGRAARRAHSAGRVRPRFCPIAARRRARPGRRGRRRPGRRAGTGRPQAGVLCILRRRSAVIRAEVVHARHLSRRYPPCRAILADEEVLQLSWARQHACLSNPPPAPRSQPAPRVYSTSRPRTRAGQFGVLEPATRAGVFGFFALLPPSPTQPEFGRICPLPKICRRQQSLDRPRRWPAGGLRWALVWLPALESWPPAAARRTQPPERRRAAR